MCIGYDPVVDILFAAVLSTWVPAAAVGELWASRSMWCGWWTQMASSNLVNDLVKTQPSELDWGLNDLQHFQPLQKYSKYGPWLIWKSVHSPRGGEICFLCGSISEPPRCFQRPPSCQRNDEFQACKSCLEAQFRDRPKGPVDAKYFNLLLKFLIYYLLSRFSTIF